MRVENASESIDFEKIQITKQPNLAMGANLDE
jgi:hypothetical protein